MGISVPYCIAKWSRKEHVLFMSVSPECLTVSDALKAQQAIESNRCSSEESSWTHTGAGEEPARSSCRCVLSLAGWLLPPVNCCTHWEALQPHCWCVGELPKPCSKLGPWGACEVILSLLLEKLTVILAEVSGQNPDTLILSSPHTSIGNVPSTTQENWIHFHNKSLPPFSSQEEKAF